jgi:hypothetical protein
MVVELKCDTLSRESIHEYWPHWLSKHAVPFEAQPYQHLAATMRDTGHATEAREILIELEDERHRQNGSKRASARLWHWIKRTFISHGYRPGRALGGVAGVFVIAVIVTLSARQAGWIHQPVLRVQGTTVGTAFDEVVSVPCSVGDTIRLAADLSVPLINSGGRLRCDFEHDKVGAQVGTVLGILLQILGWAFATLFVVGFTGAIRKI